MALFHRAKRQDLASRLERKGTQLSQMAAEKGTETSRRVADILRRASEDIRSVEAGNVREKAMSAVNTARETVDNTAEMARGNIRSHPLTSVAMAMGLGMIAGATVAMIGSSVAHKHEY
jgi:ElaB/YqjD/DUF883 family membrane-anchored ribosome-binding protein